MSIDKITKLAASLAKQADNQEKFLAPVLASKLVKASEIYPHDPTIIGLASVIGKYADKNTFISRGEIKDLYRRFYSRNNKFAELFEEELGESEQLATPKFAQRENEAVEVKTDYLADQVLSNALESVFDSSSPLKMYAKDAGNKAKTAVASTLDVWNLSPSNLEIETGNEKFIVVKANYETPKGVTGFYVPVQIVNGKIASPSVFIGNGSPEDLNHGNVKNYITKSAGVKLKISAENILNALTKAASEDREISDTELALARLNTSRRTQQDFFSNQVLSQQVDQEVKEIQLPKYSEFSHLEEKFASPYGIASFNLGEDKVNTGREVVARSLASFGTKNAQITVADSNQNTVTYAVSLNSGKVAFKVPVKIENGKVNPPTVMLCQGSVTSFDAEGINKLFVQNITDYKAAATASAHYGLKPSDLVDNIRQAMQENNLAKAEDALNVLAESGDSKAYASGFQVYASGLKGEAEANDITNHPLYNANDFYTTSASKVAISKQTGLPINKIYIDENGNHRPMYRRGMQESYQGGFFMNYKIFG
jgi:hypothetical protein